MTSVSKSLAPGLRVGYVAAPPAVRRALASSLGSSTWAAPLMAEVVTRWIHDGTAVRLTERRVQTATERQRLAYTILGGAVVRGPLRSFHLWLPLPEPWRVDQFVVQAAALGVSLASTDIFVPARAPTPHAIRVCTGTEADPGRVEEGLRTVARMLKSGPGSYSVSGV